MSANDGNDTARDVTSNAVDLWTKAFEEQVTDWREAAEKMSQFRYGPADAAMDFQRATERTLRLWGMGWLGGIPGWGSGLGGFPGWGSGLDRKKATEDFEAQYKRAQAAYGASGNEVPK